MTKARYGEGGVTFDPERRLWIGTADFGRDPRTGKRRRRRVTAKDRDVMIAKLRTLQARGAIAWTDPAVELSRTGAWLEYWVANIAPRTLKPDSLTRYESVVRVHLVPHLGKIKLEQLRPEHVERMLAAIEADGAAPATVIKVRSILRRALNVALRRGYVARNVALMIDPPPTPAPKTDDALTAKEAERVLRAARGDRWEALAVLALLCGFRQGELLALSWSDVDLRTGAVKVRDAKTRAGVRTVPLPGPAVDALKTHRAAQRVERMAADVWGDPQLVFTTAVGTTVNRHNLVVRWWKPLLTKAKVTPRRFHASRHTAATLMLARGVHLEVISKVLGHARYAITADVYAHVGVELLRGAADAMGDQFAHVYS